MPQAAFTLKLGEGQNRVSLELLAEALENALTMLRSVGEGFIPPGVEVNWVVVAASLRSPLTITVEPRVTGRGRGVRTVGKRIIDATTNGIKQLEEKAELPPHFSEDAIRATQNMIKAAQKDGAKLMAGAAEPKRQVTLTERAVEHITQVVERARVYVDEGTIEGQLEVISVHDGLHFVMWEEGTKCKVECRINENLLGQAKDLLGKRVAVTGRIRYRNHKPISIQVERIRQLRGMDDILRLADIPPLDITGGLSSEEYVRRLRDAQ